MSLRIPILLIAALVSIPLNSQSPSAQASIETVLNAQVQAWNRGDIQSFVGSYADDCIFVGKQMLQGRAKLLARYQKSYPSPEAMGKLTFRNLAVHQLDQEIAIAIGDWHIDRSAASGGPVGGIFSLVLHNRGGIWQIVLDHTA